MRAISLFSGVGGFEIGFGRAGIETVLQAEQDPWALRVLARHWPTTERVTDVRDVGAHRLDRRDLGLVCPVTGIDHSTERGKGASIDLVYGGFPCQDLSVAGQRAGLRGERSSLWFEFWRVLSELRPRWAVIENVPGLLSVCSCALCAVAAERIAAHNRDRGGTACDCVECRAGQQLRRHHQGRDFARILAGLDELGFAVAWAVLDAQHFGVPQRRRRVFIVGGPDRRACEQVLALCESCAGHPTPSREEGQRLAYTLEARSGGVKPAWNTTYVASGVTARYGKGTDSDADDALIVASTLSASYGKSLDSAGSHGVGPVNAVYALRSDASRNGIARTPSADAEGRIRLRDHGFNVYPYAPTLDSAPHTVGGAMGVRRLTPLECERLMGWPDDWTRWADDGTEIADAHRYRMCGNGVVATVAEWIGWRLVAVDRNLVLSATTGAEGRG